VHHEVSFNAPPSLGRRFERAATVTAILTCYNRRDQTLACLQSLYSQALPSGVVLNAVVVDDGSTDGTQAAVRGAFPETNVIRAPGNLYWAGGMALAERIALQGDPDYLLWLNDDVTLDKDALTVLFGANEATKAGHGIVVGALRDPTTDVLTYSGVRRRGFHPLRVETVSPDAEPRVVEMFHGNVVLVSRAAYLATGRIDGAFSHAHADFDYGLRAARAGIVCILAPGTVGTCADDNPEHPWLDASLSASVRLRLVLSRKGLPPRSTARYLRRHGGDFWPIFWLAPYIRALLLPACQTIVQRLRAR
jgi:GT2 family glycosyltransferase